jgi:hypothetical protein
MGGVHQDAGGVLQRHGGLEADPVHLENLKPKFSFTKAPEELGCQIFMPQYPNNDKIFI